MRGEVAAAAEEILGHPYSGSRVSYWQAEGKTAWILKVRGKTHLITTGIVVDRGQVASCEVLVYRESRGGEVRSERFLRQFNGAELRNDLTLDRSVDGITGATISVNALKKATRLALYLDSSMKE